jgi:signal transduction histidine kinase
MSNSGKDRLDIGDPVVLIVDDQPKNLEILAEILSREGLKVAVAQNGQQAVDVACAKPPDLILMDVSMPVLDGFSACERLKSCTSASEIPIIFLTARTEEEDIVRGFEIGGSDYVTKPFRAAELLARVKTHLALSHSQRMIRRQNESLLELNATKDKFFSIMAHDIKNPVAAFQQIATLLLDERRSVDEDTKKDLFRMMHQSASELFSLLDNLLTWSRSQTGRIDFKPSPLPLEPAVREVMSLMAAGALKKNISLKQELPENMSAFFDPDMLKTILRNLVSNAIKFTPEDGLITVKARELGDFIELSVSDTGTGLSPADMEKLFRIDVSNVTIGPASKEKGSGLGLILCREFVERHGGKIWVESILEKGSTFFFSLPVKPVGRQ